MGVTHHSGTPQRRGTAQLLLVQVREPNGEGLRRWKNLQLGPLLWLSNMDSCLSSRNDVPSLFPPASLFSRWAGPATKPGGQEVWKAVFKAPSPEQLDKSTWGWGTLEQYHWAIFKAREELIPYLSFRTLGCRLQQPTLDN